MELSQISYHRNSIMGIAILWIMMYHMPYLNSIAGSLIGSAILIGFCGVDIFFFLSSFGIYYSFQKQQTLKSFYKKRILRILPSYWTILIIFGILHGLAVSNIIKEMSMLGMFLPFLNWPMFDWYIPAQMFLYFVSPIIILHISKTKKNFVIILIGSFLIHIIISSILLQHKWDQNILFLIPRIPAFFLGAIFAKYSLQNKKLTIKEEILSYVIMAISILILFFIKTQCSDKTIIIYGLNHFPFLFAIPGFIIMLIRFFSCINHIILNYINLLGQHSLELYLIHWNLYTFRHTLPSIIGLSEIVYLIICFFASFPLAFLLKIIITHITNTLIRHERNRI